MERATFTLEPEAFAFLQQMAGRNRSAYINQLIKAEKQRTLEEHILRANQEEAEDTDYQQELAEWEVTLTDGLGE
ncbi:MAG: hypothetical protein R3A44_31060 [Caldilineaceae bacterium]